MLVLLQILKILSGEDRECLKEYLSDREEGFTIEDQVECIPDFLFNHMGLHLELNKIQKETLVRIIENGSWKAAFNTIELIKE